MSTLICLGGGIEGKPILERAKALGHRLVVVDGNSLAPGMALADGAIKASCYDVDETVRGLKMSRAVDNTPFDGVLCCAIDAPHVAAAVAQEFGLPGLIPELASFSANKLDQKTLLRQAGLPVPDFWLNGHDMPVGIDSFVIKPQDSRGARGVYLVRKHGPVLADWVRDARAQSKTGNYLTEQFLDGPQLSTESIIQDGRVLFTAIGLRNYDRLAEFAPHIIEDGYDMPYGDWTIQVGVDHLLERACRALGWDNLTVKGDWIIHDDQLVILELAARLSGGFFGTHGIPLAYGRPFVEWAIKLALGEKIKKPRPLSDFWTEHVCQRYLFPAPEDIGRRVKDLPNIWRYSRESDVINALVWPTSLKHMTGYYQHDLEGANFISFAIHPGDVIAPVVSHGQRWGQATCTGATPEQARERAERAVAAMKRSVVLE